jgi:hypothetical protein
MWQGTPPPLNFRIYAVKSAILIVISMRITLFLTLKAMMVMIMTSIQKASLLRVLKMWQTIIKA